MEQITNTSNVVFVLLGAIMVLAMHAGFAFLEVGTVRKKNQVNALVKILTDFGVSAIAYFFIGYTVAYGVNFLLQRRSAGAEERLRDGQVLLPADLRRCHSGHHLRRHRRERAKFHPQSVATFLLVASSIPSSRASPGTTTSASSHGWKRPSAPSSMTSPARWWCMRSAAGSPCPPCCCSAPAAAATPRTATWPPTRLPTSPSWPSARGSSPSAGSAST